MGLNFVHHSKPVDGLDSRDIVNSSPRLALIGGSHGALLQISVPETVKTDEKIMVTAKIID